MAAESFPPNNSGDRSGQLHDRAPSNRAESTQIFVDTTGRRRQRILRVAYLFAGLGLAYTGLVGVSITGGAPAPTQSRTGVGDPDPAALGTPPVQLVDPRPTPAEPRPDKLTQPEAEPPTAHPSTDAAPGGPSTTQVPVTSTTSPAPTSSRPRNPPPTPSGPQAGTPAPSTPGPAPAPGGPTPPAPAPSKPAPAPSPPAPAPSPPAPAPEPAPIKPALTDLVLAPATSLLNEVTDGLGLGRAID